MKIRYVWPNSDVVKGGMLSPTLIAAKLVLVRKAWLNPDYTRTELGVDCFCISATKAEIEKHVIHLINSDQHRQLVLGNLGFDRIALPFLVTRDLKYIQMLERFPWKDIGSEAKSFPAPPFELHFDATIAGLSMLDILPMPNQKLERHREVYKSHVRKKISLQDAVKMNADDVLWLGS